MRPSRPTSCALFAVGLLSGLAADAQAQMAITSGQSAASLASQLAPGIGISNPRRSTANEAVGIFSGGASLISLGTGIVLSSGRAVDALGPNDDNPEFGTNLGGSASNPDGHDPDLAALLGDRGDPEDPGDDLPASIFDATTLEFDFTCPPTSGRVKVDLVFASEEYPAGLADGVGLFIDQVNTASIPGSSSAVSTETLSAGETPFLFRENGPCAPGCPLNLEANGLSTKLTAQAAISPGSHAFKAVVGDNQDPEVDSWLFLSSFQCLPHACGDGQVGPGEQCDDGNTANGDCCSSTCQKEALSFSFAPPASVVVGGQTFSSGTVRFEQVFTSSEVWGFPQLEGNPSVGLPVSVSLGAAPTPIFNLAWSSDPLDAPQVVEVVGSFVPTGSQQPAAAFTTLVGPIACPVGNFSYLPQPLSADARARRTLLVNLGATTAAQDNTSLLVHQGNAPSLVADSGSSVDGNFQMLNGQDTPWFVGYVLNAPPLQSLPPRVPALGPAALGLGGALSWITVVVWRRRGRTAPGQRCAVTSRRHLR